MLNTPEIPPKFIEHCKRAIMHAEATPPDPLKALFAARDAVSVMGAEIGWGVKIFKKNGAVAKRNDYGFPLMPGCQARR